MPRSRHAARQYEPKQYAWAPPAELAAKFARLVASSSFFYPDLDKVAHDRSMVGGVARRLLECVRVNTEGGLMLVSMKNEVVVLASACRKVLDAGPDRLDDEYFYNSVPLCVIDAVYSIGVRYEGVRNVISRFTSAMDLRKFRPDRSEVPARDQQMPTSELVRKMREVGAEVFGAQVFQNRQRTSTRSGILKSEAVLRFAEALVTRGGEHLQDIPGLRESGKLKSDIEAIPGQGSGLSFGYFFMLAGSEQRIKPDRMILRFLSRTLDRDVTVSEAEPLLVAACGSLESDYPELTPRLLDHCIWHVQRGEG